MYDGYFALGGTEVANRQRAYGYALTGDCKIPWFRLSDCVGLWDALGDSPYTQDNLEDAPWWDPALPETARFFGVYTEQITGIPDATTTATSTEGILDGGVTGGVRQAIRQVRIVAMLTALGMDALEAGMSWLRAAVGPGECVTHAGSCGAQDACFFVMCPGEREITEVRTWVIDVPGYDITHPSEVLYSSNGTSAAGWAAVLLDDAGSGATGASILPAGSTGTPYLRLRVDGAAQATDPSASAEATYKVETIPGVGVSVTASLLGGLEGTVSQLRLGETESDWEVYDGADGGYGPWYTTTTNRYANPSFETASLIPAGAEQSADWSVSGGFSLHVLPVPYPATTLYPSTTLYPGSP